MSRMYDLMKGIANDGLQPRPESTKRYGDRSFRRHPSHSERFRRAHDVQDQGWIHMLSILQKHWILSALFAVSVFVSVTIATLLTKPVYAPAVTLEIDPPGTQALSLERSTGEGSDDAQYLETQAKTLQSDELALAVIRKLGLDHNPNFVNTSRQKQNLTETGHTNEAAVQLGPGENAALNTFRTRLKVERDTGSRLVTVSFANHDPVTAAQVANTLVSEFIHNNFEVRHEAIMETSAWLSRQLDDVRARMDQSNRAFIEFQKETGIADVDMNKNTLAEQMGELDRQLALAQSDRIQFEALLAKTQRASPESLPQANDNPVVQQLTHKLAEARAELAKAQVDYGENHPTLKKLQSEVDQLQTELDFQRRRIFERFQTAYAAAQLRERLLEQQRKLTGKQLNQLAQYNTLKKELQTETELYNSLYARVKEAGIAAASNSYNVRVIDHARVLTRPTEPRTLLNLCFGLLASVFGGIMIACVREALDSRIHTPEDIRKATGIPTVSVLPVIGEGDGSPTALGKAFAHYLKINTNGNHCIPKFLLERPDSAAAEALRGLHATVMHSGEARLPQALLVISALAGEGKTTIASNLAIALARRGPTCLADADLRRTGISRTFGLHGRRGLADLLSASAALEDVITKVPDVPNLSIVPSGTAHQNPGELMADESVCRVVTALRERFDFLVFDSPPILPYADARVMSTLVDGLIVVVQYRTTTRAAIKRSMEILSQINAAPILEVVLNGGDSIVPDLKYYRSGY